MTNTTHDFALERQAIGVLMVAPASLGRAGGISEESFADEKNARVWRLVCRALSHNVSLSPEALYAFDRKEVREIGGVDALQSYRESAQYGITDPEPIFTRLHELHRWRQLTRIAQHLAAEAIRQDVAPEELLSRLADKAQKLLATGRDSARGKKEVAETAVRRALDDRPVVTTGLNTLDYMLQGGLQGRRLYGIGGLYGRGKTILLGSISDNLNLQGVNHLFMSMETDPEDIELRSCAKHFNANAALLVDRHSPEHESLMANAESYITDVPEHTWYEFCPGASLNEIHRMILRAKARYNIQGFMLDYWQLIEGRERGQGEEAHHRSNINKLAAICRQENLWGVVTAQIDDKGRLKYSDSLLQAAALYVRLVREEDGMDIRLEVEKSNYTRYASTFQASLSGMVFDAASGPHVRDQVAVDAPDAAREGHDDHISL